MNWPDTRDLRTRAWVRRLQEEYDHICFTYRLRLRRPVIRVASFGNIHGRWDPELREISLSENLIESAPWAAVLEVLKHEIAHQRVWEEWGSDEGHGALFRRACSQMGMPNWAMRAEAEIVVPEPGIPTSALTPEETRLVERAEKLLRLANSRNENEASAAMKKVREMYARYEIDRLHARKGSQYVSLVIYTGKKRIERYQSAIAGILNDHFLVDVIHIHTYDVRVNQEHKALELLGTVPNVKMAEYVYHYLCQSLASLWKDAAPRGQGGLRRRNSFYMGVLAGFRERMEADNKNASQENALVAPPDPQLDAFVDSRFPRLVRIGGGRRQVDGPAFDSGKARGRALILRRPVAGETRGLGRFLPRSG